MDAIEGADRLLFELASADRLIIMTEIQKEPLKLSQVARRHSATVQETFRQLERLAKAQLIEKNPSGAYDLTSLGKEALSLVRSFGFLAREKEFVLDHDLTSIPRGYHERIGELLSARRVDHLDDVLDAEERIIRESREYVWFMTDQMFGHPSHQPHRDQIERVSMRLLLPHGLDPGPLLRDLRPLGVEPEVRFVDRVNAAMVLSEKMAALAFPSLDGRLDYGRGFVGDSEEFHEWCLDLYSHYWAKAEG